MDDLVALGSKQDEDGVKQADERPWRCEPKEYPFVPLWAKESTQCKARNHGCPKGNTEEHGYASGNDTIRNVRALRFATNDADEEYGKRCKKNYLQDRVDSDKYSAVLIVATRKAVPD
jgi:hypothetical protein